VPNRKELERKLGVKPIVAHTLSIWEVTRHIDTFTKIFGGVTSKRR